MTTLLIFHVATLIVIFANQDLNEIEYQNRNYSYQTIFDKVSVALLFSALLFSDLWYRFLQQTRKLFEFACFLKNALYSTCNIKYCTVYNNCYALNIFIIKRLSSTPEGIYSIFIMLALVYLMKKAKPESKPGLNYLRHRINQIIAEIQDQSGICFLAGSLQVIHQLYFSYFVDSVCFILRRTSAFCKKKKFKRPTKNVDPDWFLSLTSSFHK